MPDKPTYDELVQRVAELEAKLTATQAPSLGDQIAEYLFKEWESTGPPGILDVKQLAHWLSVSADDIQKAVVDPITNGLIDQDQAQTALYLTPEGYDRLYQKATS